MSKISIKAITKKLMEDFPQAKYPSSSKSAAPVELSTGKNEVAQKPSYNKMDKTKRTKPSLPPKMERAKAANAGPETPPKSNKLSANNVQKKKAVPSVNLKVSKNSDAVSPILNADDIERVGAAPVQWSASNDSSTEKFIGRCLAGCDPKSVKKISFNVSKPTNVDYGIVPTGEILRTSQSHSLKKSSTQLKLSEGTETPKLLKNDVVNGTVKVTIGKRSHVFEAATVDMLNSMAKNYSSVGQPISFEVKRGLRESYADRKFVTSIMEAIHAQTLDVGSIHKEKVQEALGRFKTLLENQYVAFHNRSRKKWLKECVVPAFEQAYSAFSKIYSTLLETYEVTVKTRSKNGIELVDVISRGLNENYAAFSAMEEVMRESPASTRVESAIIGSRRIMAEEVESIHTKALSFDDMPDTFKNAGFGYTNTKRIDPKAPKADKLKAPTKSRTHGAKVYSPKGKSANPESLVNKDGKRHADKAQPNRKAPTKTGPRFPDHQ